MKWISFPVLVLSTPATGFEALYNFQFDFSNTSFSAIAALKFLPSNPDSFIYIECQAWDGVNP